MFDNPTNRNRVKLIGETLDKLERSAKSNRITSKETAELLQPVLQRFLDYRYSIDQIEPQKGEIAKIHPQGKPHNWTTIRECAEKAPLKDLTMALAVYMSRVEELVND